MDMPIPFACNLKVGSLIVDNFYDYTIRFYASPEGPRPTLYFKGKRVIQAWSISLYHSQPEDTEGCSA